MCVEAFCEECNQAQADTCPQNQAQGKQARDRRADAAPSGCLHVLESSVCVKSGEAACSTKWLHFDGAQATCRPFGPAIFKCTTKAQ